MAGQGFDLHPRAAQDIADIWTRIAEDSPQAARRVREARAAPPPRDGCHPESQRLAGDMDTEQTLLEILRALPAEKQQEILDHAQRLRAGTQRPRKSGRGLWADLGIDLTAQDIDGARREMWKNFPRDDF